MAEEERRPNPFIEGLKRAAMVPVNAVQFLPRLGNELLGSPVARQQEFARTAQRDLKQRVTGEPVPYSEGRDWAHFLSLGLVPDNPVADVDPRQLNPEQAQRFQQMTPLQQALLQAKRPQDFADLLTQDDLFAEQGPNLVNVSPGGAVFDTRAGEEVYRNPVGGKPVSVAPGNALVDPNTNEEVYRNDQGRPMTDYEEGRLGIERDKGRSAAAANAARIRKLDAETAKLNREAAGGQAVPIGDRAKIQMMESRVAGQVSKATKDLSRGVTAIRNIFNLGQIRDATKIPPNLVSELKSYGFADPEVGLPLSERAPGSVRNLLLLTNVVRLSDPPGRITDKDVDMYSRAREYLSPGVVDAAIRGEVWTPPQEAEAIQASMRLSKGLLETHDRAVLDGRKAALRDRLAGNGLGMDPHNAAPDGMADVRERLMGQQLPDPTQAQYPIADAETEDMLQQLWAKIRPGQPLTPEAFVEFANTLGFGIGAAPSAGDQLTPDLVQQMFEDFVQAGGNPEDEAGLRAYAEKLGVTLPE